AAGGGPVGPESVVGRGLHRERPLARAGEDTDGPRTSAGPRGRVGGV
ncbi:MAG: hypothetical protein AVDCRST_MAG01-01-4888, partial [uncultured Rubrobacteraceae bacterium]